MRKFYHLRVAAKRNETRDSVRLALDVPKELREFFAFQPGQHLPLRATVDGKLVRRTYSICSAQHAWPLEIGVRVQPGGAFSGYVANELQPGDELEVMPPFGQFHKGSNGRGAKAYVAFAAGSGITPILSIVASILAEEADSEVCLFYGNRRLATTMFIDDLYALKNRYPSRLQLHFVFSQEEQEFPIAAGRLDADKVRDLWARFLHGMEPDEAFICGPDTMIDTVRETLAELGMSAASVHAEHFGAPKKVQRQMPAVSAGKGSTEVTVVMDGHRTSFEMLESDSNIVDAAAAHGIDLPYSCKGGVCATCRCHLREGEVVMAVNHGLELWELEKGYILACQSTPVTPTLTLDYDLA
ncbi:MAG TPA: 2Fe-2S iron-sulfur cluster-binding protein [Woeseiaceae bacterium]|nr:2Fe-2S iron-sulfur cluster-binding protein [Woeseiaceae bacterium]